MRAIFIVLVFATGSCAGQTAYFIDGYHGGIYGHIPAWQTQFMVDKLKEYPDWRINLELEPESWDTIQVRDRAAYDAFRELMAVPDGRVEYVNPAYGQSYLFNISGESVIRQLYYGMKKLREHFPTIRFTTYSSEEPCFTSALPQLLRSYGFRYASLKNPNTCWGGYTRAFGGELVNWVGPDGSSIVAVPRYGMEALQPGSTWQTIAFGNAEEYVRGALAAGIRHPVGMTLQDAGWKYGPWLRGRNGVYVTWREYFEKVATDSVREDWKFSQEDVLVSLMWGTQVLQRIARSVRAAENIIVQSEKVAAMRCIGGGAMWPGDSLDVAWRSLLLAQHHDCWIVPYNGRPGDTWADKVVRWTGNTSGVAARIIGEAGGKERSNGKIEGKYKRYVIYNTTGADRREWVDAGGVVFQASVPAMGYKSYRREDMGRVPGRLAYAVRQENGIYRVETDLYRMLIDPAHGGVIKSLRAKKMGDKEFVKEGFNGLRGNFYNDGGFHGSTDTSARVRIVESGGCRVKVEIQGTIAGHPFTNLLTLTAGEPRIDCSLRIDWKGNPGIGESGGPSSDKEVRKSYYDDRFKLLALFPPAFQVEKVYKNAPFDVTESGLSNTFFNRWDSIKNNVLSNWVDVEDRNGDFGLALFCDHTTSYVHGEGYPLGLTLQYSGNGIFYRNYRINGATEVSYALLPHAGRWDRAGVAAAAVRWNEPLLVTAGEGMGGHSFVRPLVRGWEVSSMRMEGKDLLVRVFNAEGPTEGKIGIGFKADEVWVEELDGRKAEELKVQGLEKELRKGDNRKGLGKGDNMKGSVEIGISEQDGKKGMKEVKSNEGILLRLPRFGVRTLRFVNVRI